MKEAVYLFAVCLFAFIRSGTPNSFETVWLKDVTTSFQTDKRALIDSDLPNDLTFHLTRGSETLTLDLKRNHDINPHADVYFARKLKNGRPVLLKSRNYEKEDVAYYQDRENWAYMTVRCVKKSNEACDRIINGNLRIGDRIYDVQPEETDVTSRNLVEDRGGLGKKYVLKDQTHMQRRHSVQKIGITSVNEDNGEHNITAFLPRFRGQHKRKNLSPLDDMLYSRNVLNRTATDKSRELRKVYHVKVAVLIDSSAWEFYVSAFKQTNPLTRSRNTKRKIKQMYSHIFNGVNLLYKGIQDPAISINIILASFIFFKTYTEFPHVRSRAVLFNKTHYIDADKYINDTQKWDLNVGARLQPVYDHGMLITMYTLFQGNMDSFIKSDNYIGGIAATGRVCDIGHRNSVVQIRDFDTMVISVAHELGHSLGARHDGTNEAIHCRAEDKFIMSSLKYEPDPTLAYSRNPWLFSHCSVTSFKNTLKNKACVTIPGNYYDHQEYTQHVMTQAGKVYIANEQCELIYGPGSFVCETSMGNICQLMRCFEPKRRICPKAYYIAARGTQCGSRKWCIEGQCVSEY